jgi:hypothetical protein
MSTFITYPLDGILLCKCFTSVYTANETLSVFVHHLHRPWAVLLKQGSDAAARLMAHMVALRAAFSFWASAARNQTCTAAQRSKYKGVSQYHTEYFCPILVFFRYRD